MPTDDYHPYWREFSKIDFYPISIGAITVFVILLLLLICSALVSGSEVAFFSLSPSNKKKIEDKKQDSSFRRVLYLLARPEKLLAAILIANNFINIGIVILSSFFFDNLINFNDLYTFELLARPEKLLAAILIANNFINIGIVILSSFFFDNLINFNDLYTFEFVFKVVIITFLILLFGEIIPKIFATQYAMNVVKLMAFPLYSFEKICKPITILMVLITSFLQTKFKSYNKNISIKELSHAIDLASDEIEDEKEMLKGIVKFSNIEVQEIMCPRVNVVAANIKTTFAKLKSIILKSGFSRIPVYHESLDNIKGIIYIKDLISHLSGEDNHNWPTLIRKPYFVPEHKKINDLLVEFKRDKNHIAIAVDEYGGTAGIITMEDILEEVVGEIYDESDVDAKSYEQISNNTYSFIGKIQLNDFYKILKIPKDSFEKIKGDADSLAGLLLELKGELPLKDEKIEYKNFCFLIEAVDKKRIKKVRVIKSIADEQM